MSKPPGNIRRHRWSRWALIAALGCTEKPNECMDGFALSPAGHCEAIAPNDTGLANTPPTAPTLAVQPAAPRQSGADLNCIVVDPSIDTDGDAVAYTLEWARNGTAESGDGERFRANDTIGVDRLTEGDEWTCTATPTDGFADGPAASTSVSIGPPPMGWDDRLISLSNADHTLTGEANGSCAGSALAAAGDLDMDGRMDFIVSDTWWSHPDTGRLAGKAYIVLGADLGGNRSTDLAHAAWSFEGQQGAIEDDPDCEEEGLFSTRCGGDWAGHSASGGFDADGDGIPDLLITAYRSDERGVNRGKFAFYSGSDLGPHGARSIDSAELQIHGENDADKMGHSVSWAGDVDGDGLSEMVTGSAYSSANGRRSGRAYLLPGTAFSERGSMDMADTNAMIWNGEHAEDRVGQITGRLGDIDGDGLADFVVSSLRNQDNGIGEGDEEFRGTGKVYVLLGADVTGAGWGSVQSLADAASAWMGETPGDAVGYGSNTVGDFDGDGLPDVGVGAYGHSEGGRERGKAYVITAENVAAGGQHSLEDASYAFVGEANNDWAGKSMSGADDIDRDGRDDLLIGAMGHSPEGEELAGRAYLILAASVEPGTHGIEDADRIFEGERAWDAAGSSVLGPGDVNGDGLPDLLVGAWQGDAAEGSNGRVYLLLNP